MTEKQIELTRRNVLAGLGAVGVAGAGAGLGTSAYFNDSESFANNTLTAGSLDLRVDWEEHYWNDFDLGEDVSVEYVDGKDEVDDDQIGLPDPEDPQIAVAQDDLAAFMDATAVEAYPDANDNGIQDGLEHYDACEHFAQLDRDLHPVNGGYDVPDSDVAHAKRTNNEDTMLAERPAPLVNLDDVKPGDFGELTLSFHLCDNPGYVWLQGELVDAAENGHTEPEAAAGNESGGANTQNATGTDVELLDEIQTLLWYDEDGDNVFEPGGEAGEEVDVALVLDRSGSMDGTKEQEMKSAAKNLVDALNLGQNAAQVGLVSFSNQESLDHALSTDAASVKTAIDDVSTGGGTNIEGGVNGAQEELTGTDLSNEISPSGNARSSAEKIMVVLSDGSPNEDDNEVGGSDGDDDPTDEATRAKDAGIELYSVALGGGADTTTLEAMASDPKADHFYDGSTSELEQIFGQISQQIAGEQAFFRGSLQELLDAASSGSGIPLDGDRSTAFDETADDPAAASRDEFVDSTNNFVGLSWWLPRSVGNQIQSDSVGFNLGFYTEQSRHNDGSGQATATSTSAPGT